jgi:hypothetical protein
MSVYNFSINRIIIAAIIFENVGADGPNRRTVKRMCVNECIVVVVQSVFYLRT